MKRMVIVAVLIMNLLVQTNLLAKASEKCLASFADSEWVNGTPSGVKNLLGFDLVEKITKTPGRALSPIDTFYLFGEHTEKITYNYAGKNCTTRDVVVLGRLVNEQSMKFVYQTIDEFISKNASNFLIQENTKKYYSNLKMFFSNKTFDVQSKQVLPQEHISGSTRYIQGYLIREMNKFQEPTLWPDSAFIYFPNKCGFWSTNDDNGNETREKVYAGGVGRYPSGGVIKFESEGVCIAELRQGGVAEKLADIKYLVASTKSRMTIICRKGNTTKNIKGINPKCPKGYTKK